MIRYTTFATPYWNITVAGDEQGLCRLHLDVEEDSRSFTYEEGWMHDDAFFDDVRDQILRYFDGTLTRFDVRLNPSGTPFQKTVWEYLYTIPYGETRTYKDIAVALGKATASRAVGMANATNPIPLIVPCHRVIGSSGKLTGFAYGLEAKSRLLAIEGVTQFRLA